MNSTTTLLRYKYSTRREECTYVNCESDLTHVEKNYNMFMLVKLKITTQTLFCRCLFINFVKYFKTSCKNVTLIITV